MNQLADQLQHALHDANAAVLAEYAEAIPRQRETIRQLAARLRDVRP